MKALLRSRESPRIRFTAWRGENQTAGHMRLLTTGDSPVIVCGPVRGVIVDPSPEGRGHWAPPPGPTPHRSRTQPRFRYPHPRIPLGTVIPLTRRVRAARTVRAQVPSVHRADSSRRCPWITESICYSRCGSYLSGECTQAQPRPLADRGDGRTVASAHIKALYGDRLVLVRPPASGRSTDVSPCG
jgi:hypothetical protein